MESVKKTLLRNFRALSNILQHFFAENIFKNPQYVIQLKEGWKHSESFPGCMLLISLLRKDYVEKKDDIPNFGFHIYKVFIYK